jgi:predicted DNA binding CopG/RHH family protein
MKSEWKRICESCGRELTYSSSRNYKRACKQNTKCNGCSRKGVKRTPEQIERIRKATKTAMNSDEIRDKIKRGMDNPRVKEILRQSVINNCHTPEAVKKMSESKKGSIPWNKGKVIGPIHTEKHRENLRNRMLKNNPFKGKTHTKSTRELLSKKSRINLAKRLLDAHGDGFIPGYNKDACRIIDEYGGRHGYDFQHALKGGEFHIKELGYWVDGYDKNKNVVIEIDENAHFDENGELSEKDVKRQQEIEKFLKCKFIRLKYDECK